MSQMAGDATNSVETAPGVVQGAASILPLVGRSCRLCSACYHASQNLVRARVLAELEPLADFPNIWANKCGGNGMLMVRLLGLGKPRARKQLVRKRNPFHRRLRRYLSLLHERANSATAIRSVAKAVATVPSPSSVITPLETRRCLCILWTRRWQREGCQEAQALFGLSAHLLLQLCMSIEGLV